LLSALNSKLNSEAYHPVCNLNQSFDFCRYP
jgi:hypothetical protein